MRAIAEPTVHLSEPRDLDSEVGEPEESEPVVRPETEDGNPGIIRVLGTQEGALDARVFGKRPAGNRRTGQPVH